jgi:hypothetical protein
MREENEIREALKRLKDERSRRMQQPGLYSRLEMRGMMGMLAMIGALKWGLGDKETLPDFK